jgi:outer membrane biogenesis lipoprotein LolB
MKNYILSACASLILVGCVGPQTRQAFTLRQPVHTWEVTSPNRAEQRSNNLDQAIARAAQDQEAADSLDWSYGYDDRRLHCVYDIDSDAWACPTN